MSAGGPSRRAVLLTGTTGLLALAGLAPDNGIEVPGRQARSALGAATTRDHGGAPGTAPGTASQATVDRLAVRDSRTATHRRSGRAPIRSLADVNHRLHRHAYGPRAIMLTLDDGPHPIWTPRMLDLLEHNGITATFFMIGSQVHRHPGVVREVAARGHVIGNHTWTHDETLGSRSVHRIRTEIDRTSHAIHQACGVVPTQFRAPGGNWAPRLLDVLADKHLIPVGWDVDPADWARPGTRSILRTLRHVRRDDIVLCHDGGGDRSQTYRALHRALPQLKHHGFTFATLPARLTTSVL